MLGTLLHATDLCSKFGFDDGDLLMYHFYEIEFHESSPDSALNTFDSTVLVHLVRKHLGPLLPGVELYEISSCHNPIRAQSEHHELIETQFANVYATITEADVIAAKAEVLALWSN